MIISITADQPSFRPVHFKPGMNIILADRTDTSSKRDTRNGLGKSLLIEIIHFCLGAGVKRGEGLNVEPLQNWTFTVQLDLHTGIIDVSRSIASINYVTVEGHTASWPIQPTNEVDGKKHFKIKDWNNILGWLMYGLDPTVNAAKYTPSFRSLISYFSRRGPDAYSDPFTHNRKQSTWDIQTNNAFLLGLNHGYATELQGLRDQKKHVDNLKRGIKEGALERYLGSVGELEAEHVRLKDQFEANKAGLETFNVLPQYRQTEAEANRLTTAINKLRNERIRLERRSQYYKDSLENETEPSADKVVEVYNSAGMALPDAVVKQLEEVEEFHSKVTTNRKDFLRIEMERLAEATQEASTQLASMTKHRAELMMTLRAHGPWDEYQKLSEQQSGLKGQLENLTDRIKTIREIQESSSKHKIDKERLIQRTRLDYDERRPIWEPAISKFNANSQALYEVPGSLVIDVDEKGYAFNVEIERSGSQGIGSMKVFCYDLLLAELWSEKQQSPGMLIHDSLVFDPVDERQRASSLELAAKRAAECGFQYICTINSDMVPNPEFEDSFDFGDYVRLRLTDDSPEGCLLGFRF